MAATGPIAPLQRNGGYVAIVRGPPSKARDGSPAQGVQDAKGGGRLREPNAARPLECPIRTTGETLKGQAPLERATVCQARSALTLASQTSARGGGGSLATPRRTHCRRQLRHPNSKPRIQPPTSKKALFPCFSVRQPRKGPREATRTCVAWRLRRVSAERADCAVGSG